MNWQVGYLLSKDLDCQFLHTPLISERSGGGWDKVLGFGTGHKTAGEVNLPEEKLPDLDLGLDVDEATGRENLRKMKKRILEGPEDRIYVLPENKFPGVLAEKLWTALSELRWKYNRSRRKEKTFKVSIHLRRGDVTPDANPFRWVPNKYQIRWINFLRRYLVDHVGLRDVEFCLFSTTGKTGSFGDFPQYVRRKLDGDPIKDFREMVKSDILFAGLSNYSILAAALNTGFCFYLPLQTHCDWMETDRNPFKSNYQDATKGNIRKLRRWIDRTLGLPSYEIEHSNQT